MKPSITLFVTLLFTFFITGSAKAEVDCYHDYIDPVAICDAHTVVALSNTGTAKLFATDLDDGSYDNCHLVDYKVARMFPGWCPPGVADDTQFRDYVEFCCEDVGNTIWVILKVIDAHGNENTCMAEVTVQDNTNGNFECPPNITVSCSYWFSEDAIYNPNNRTFGTIAVMGAPRLPIIINDPGNTSVSQPKNWGLDGAAGGGVCGGGWGNNNCWVSIPEVIDYRNSCGVGVIKRKFFVECGGYSDWCWQTITIKDFSHGYYNIDWPDDIMVDACEYGVDEVDPEDLPPGYDKPNIGGHGGYNSCSLIGYAHDDLVFTFSEGACYKILREWTVIDWCKYEPNNPWSQGIWKHTQVIKLKNGVAPHFVYGCQDVEVPGYSDYCKGRYVDHPHVEDDCTPVEHLKWDYKIDLWGDGSYNITGAGTGQPSIDELLPYGWHKILWNVSDACGNYETCTYKLHVKDKKAPSPVCLYGLSTVVMPLGGMVTIWAKDFNASSYDNCTPQHKLKYSFSANPWEASRTFTCDDLGTVPIQIWVTDESGNSDYCTTFIRIDDNEGTCVGMNPIVGNVTTFGNLPIPSASASLFKLMPNQEMDEDESKGMSDVTGHFELGFGTTEFDRMVMLSRKSKQLEGMSTLDLIALHQHITGANPITEPHKLYAADLDGNGRVGANDLLLLKQALLGAYASPNYKGNLSWVFFGDPCSPTAPMDLFNNFCYNGVEVDHSGTFPASVSFKGLKMGDVNGDMINAAWVPKPRTSGTINLFTNVTETGGVEVIAGRDMELYGFQFTLSATNLQASAGIIELSNNHIGEDADGNTWFSWGQKEATFVKEGEVLFTLNGLANLGMIEGLLVDNEDVLYPEMYTEGLKTEKIRLSELSNRTITESFEVKLSPNPFSDYARLQIYLPAGEEFTVSIYDMRGVEILNRTMTSFGPQSEVVLSGETIPTSGIYYYRVKSSLGELSGKFIRQ